MKRARPRVEDFTVGWISALPVEITAASAMLDEVYEDNNDNSHYTLGRIGRHNIVIICLPTGQSDTSSATAAAVEMQRAFPALKYRLIVGIGHGVPTSETDIRLGDVVISQPQGSYSGVVRYDFDKTHSGGQQIRTGFLNAPPAILLTAVTTLRSNISSGKSSIPTYLLSLTHLPEFDKQKAGTDYLFRSSYYHVGGRTCDDCRKDMLVTRSPRETEEPAIHYGTIASGSQRIKDALTRDKLSAELKGVLCLELDSAGLMTSWSCLVIRGICDYADSHKNKKWEPFAAAAAAACAKEILSYVPAVPNSENLDPENANIRNVFPPQERTTSVADRRRIYLKSLEFDQIHTRHATIKSAHVMTCQWLLNNRQYQDWLDANKVSEHHGFLWIRGNPGSGKSTIIKFACANTKTKLTDSTVISFFFNTRGEELEKSAFGLYRSLLFQLLERLPDLQEVFDLLQPTASDSSNFYKWDREIIKDLFQQAISKLGSRCLICFIDAINECEEDQIRDVVSFFQHLGQLAISSHIYFRVCFSSRHYPVFTIESGIKLVLEYQRGHQQDITNYLDSELRIGPSRLAEQVKSQILEKASGMFLWVILTVHIINREYEYGRLRPLMKWLDEVPRGLDALFRDILTRDGQNIEELILCMQWILFAKRPLTCEELYYAILAGLEPKALDAWDSQVLSKEVMEMYILTCSKGLAELTKSKPQVVQFIHESVADYLLKGNALGQLRPNLGTNVIELSHERLKSCCRIYMEIDTWKHLQWMTPMPNASSQNAAILRRQASEKFPFLEYAVHHVLHHADASESFGVPQGDFLKGFPLQKWITLDNLLQRYQIRRHTVFASQLYIFAEKNLPNLIRIALKQVPHMDIAGERYGYPLLAAAALGNKEAVDAFLQPVCDAGPNADILDNQLHRPTFSEHQEVVHNLLNHGYRFNPKRQTLLSQAVELNDLALVKTLLATRKVDMTCRSKSNQIILSWAASNGHEEVVKLLLKRGNDLELKRHSACSDLDTLTGGHAEELNRDFCIESFGMCEEPSGFKTTFLTNPPSPATRKFTDSGYASSKYETSKEVSVEAKFVQQTADVHATSAMDQSNAAYIVENLDAVEVDEVRSMYSDISSVPDAKNEKLVVELAEELSKAIRPYQPNEQAMHRIFQILPDLLKAFALNVGGSTASQMHRDVMVFIHKYRRDIVASFVDQFSEPDATDNEQQDSEKMSLTDLMSLWISKDDTGNVGLLDDEVITPELEVIDLTQEIPEHEQEDADSPGLMAYRKLILEAPAYKSLLGNLERECILIVPEPNVMEDVRKKVLSYLPSNPRISRKISADTFKVTYRIQWDPIAFLTEQEYTQQPEDAIETAITLTGSEMSAQAVTCSRYLCQTWPATGQKILELIKHLLRGERDIRHSNRLHDSTELTAWLQAPKANSSTTLTVEVIGAANVVAEVGEQLAWLGAALRSSPLKQGVAWCRPVINDIRLLKDIPKEHPRAEIACEIDFIIDVQERYPINLNGQCWQHLFRNPVIVEGYPIPRRPDFDLNAGLEIPMNMMAGLAQAHRTSIFNGKTVLKGFSTMLVPTRYSGDVVIWHLLHRPDGNRISYLECETFPTIDIWIPILEKARHILGWCSDMEFFGGAADASYGVKFSRLPATFENCMLDKAFISSGQMLSGGYSFSTGRKDDPLHISRNGYVRKLKWISKKFVVLWDEGDKRGWLVDGTSALLHLVRASLEHDLLDKFNSVFLFRPEQMKEASQTHRSSSAIEVLLNQDNRTLKVYPEREDYIRFEDQVEHFYDLLEKVIDHQQNVVGKDGFNCRDVPRKYLEGWDFHEMATEGDPIYPRVAVLDTMGKSWVDFTRSIHAVTLFGRGFGEIIKPRNGPCFHWAKLPKGKYYLAACMSDLKDITEKLGDPYSVPMKLANNIFWHYSNRAFDQCQCKDDQDETHSDLAQVLLPSSMCRNLLQGMSCMSDLENEGAVIFGYNRHFKWFWRDTGDPSREKIDEDDVTPSKELILSPLHDSGIGQSLGSSTSKRSESMAGSSSQKYSREGSLNDPQAAYAVSDIAGMRSSLTSQGKGDHLAARDYRVGILCALPIELMAVRTLFDSTHEKLAITDEDPNYYALGRIGNHNVVAVCLPDGVYGTNSASNVASNMRRTFPAVKFCLLVGIGGGVPSSKNDIRLGDVVVSKPTGTHGGVVHYDMGKELGKRGFQLHGCLPPPPAHLMCAISDLRSDPGLPLTPLEAYLNQIKLCQPQYKHPGPQTDKFFAAGYVHEAENGSCDDCDSKREVVRMPRPSGRPEIHYGLIASGNKVMKNAEMRDQLGKDYDVLCFEMEAAGIMNTFPCLIVRGICDYADSHKNEQWQEYAAATAASFAKLLLSRVRSTPEHSESHASDLETIEVPHSRKRTLTVLPFNELSPSSKRPRFPIPSPYENHP